MSLLVKVTSPSLGFGLPLLLSVSLPAAQPPFISAIDDQVIDEDTSSGLISFTVGDPDTALVSLQLTKTSSNSDLVPAANVVIGGSGGNRTVRVTPKANAFGESVITLSVSDGQQSASESFKVTVRSVNDPPGISTFLDRNTSEDTPTGDIAFTVSDLETPVANLVVSGTSDNTSLVPNANIVFGGSGANRTVKLTPLANASGSANITISVNDGQDTVSHTFKLTVQPLNDPPTISRIADIAVAEDTSSPAIPFTIGDIDTALADLVLSKSSSNGLLIPPANILFGGAGASRTVTITPAPNLSGTATIHITVSDGGVNPATADFTVTINAVNDPPTISDIPDQALNEGKTGSVNFVVNDRDSPLANLAVIAKSSNQTLLPDANIKVSGSAELRTASFTPAPNQNGTVKITVEVTDPGGLTVADVFTLTVAPINTGPAISDITDQIVDEDAVIGPLPFTVSDADTDLDQLALTVASTVPTLVPVENIRLAGSGANRTATITPAENATGTSVITIKVSDGQVAAQDSFRVTFNAINDKPAISNIADQTISEGGTTGPLTLKINDAETEPTALVLSQASDNLTLVPLAGIVFGGSGSNRTVTVTPTAQRTGSARITVTVTDAGGATASDTFVLTVTGSGNPPQITKQPQSIVLAEGDDLVLEVIATGDPPFSYQWRFKGQDIPGATAPKLTVPKLTLLNAGDFDVVITNQAGSVTSNPATVEVKTYDFGDAPLPYPTSKPDGAAQRVQAGFGLGTPPDGEPDGQPDPTARGDDIHGTSDEDGVASPLDLVIGQANTVAVSFTDTFHATPFGQLVVWVDLNVNGSWDDAGEKFGPFQLQQTGLNNLSIPIPAGVKAGASFARFRLTADIPAQAAHGRGEEPGEVEDHLVNFRESSTEPTQDFGDAPDTYRTTLASNGARHTRIDGFHLGKLIDVEANAVPPLNGLGDDSSPVAADDEDGISVGGSFIPGQTLHIQAVTTITSGIGKLDAWIDWNRNGTFGDAGEKIFTSLTVTNGLNNLPALSVPENAVAGLTAARFRLTRQGIADWFGSATEGEVEDYQVQIQRVTQEQLDFGDAPQGTNAGYPTRLDRNGARHHFNDSLRLGKLIDLENDGQPNATATGDDTQGTADEDGVFFPAPLTPGRTNVVQVEVVSPPGALAFLDAWVDFNRDTDWADAGEKIFSGLPLANGTHTLNFLVPTDAQTGLTFSRFRLSQQGGLNFDGDGGDGEVEDVRVGIEAPSENPCDLSCEGNDFWISFPGNYAPDPANPVKPTLCIVGPINSVVTIENLAASSTFKRTNTTGTLRIELNQTTDLGNLNDAIAAKGVHITADAPIALYGLSKVTYTTDGYLAFPTGVLGTDYVVAGFGNVHSGVPELNGTQFALTATETNTTVTIIPSVGAGSRFAGVPYSVVLTNRGDCYQLRCTNDAPGDLTGTLILSDKPVAVFGGHQVANVASSDPFFADYLVEELPPVTRWGAEFYTTPLTTRSGGDTFRIIGGYDDTTVTINTTNVVNLPNKGSFHETLLTTAAQITADKPVLVMQYANSSDFDGVTNSDPFMVTVPARPQWSRSQTFTTPGTGFAAHYANVVVSMTASNSLRIDGAPFTSFSAPINGGSYVYATAPVSTGAHTVTCNEPVGVIVYGWAEFESYAWSACLFFGDTTPPAVNCNTKDIVVEAGHDSDNEPCRALVGDYRANVRATDNCGLPVPTTVTQEPPPGSFLGVGTHQIKLSVRDNAGNVGSCFFNFTVTDPNPNGPATLSCPKDILVRCTDPGGATVNYAVTALRGCTPVNDLVQCVPPPGSKFPPGTNVVTCTLTIPGRAPLSCAFNVVVDCRPRRTIKINPPTSNPNVPGSPKEIVVEFDPDSNVVLEVADSIAGPWTEVPNVLARHVIQVGQEKGKFFRLREKPSAP